MVQNAKRTKSVFDWIVIAIISQSNRIARRLLQFSSIVHCARDDVVYRRLCESLNLGNLDGVPSPIDLVNS